MFGGGGAWQGVSGVWVWSRRARNTTQASKSR